MRVQIAIVAVLASTVLRAQQPPTVFRSTTDLVEVDVVVRDRTGQFVRDLSLQDFTIEEGGRPQPIEQFFLHTVDTPGAATPAAVRAGEPPAAGRSTSRAFVVVFDDAHLSPSGFKRTQAAALTLFSQQFRPGDIGGVVTRNRMVKDRLTSDREELLKAVKEARPDSTKQARSIDERTFPRLSEIEAVRIIVNNDREVLAEAVRRVCADDESFCRRIDPEPFIRSKAEQLTQNARVESDRTLQVLRTLVNGLARFDGRKTVLLMSEGFIAEESWPLVQETVALAARANVRVYTLDGRGLERNLPAIHEAVPIENANVRLLEQMDFGADSINSLAVDTGGFVVRNTNQFDKALARIADDVNNYYVLGYRPGAAPDGKFHRISVKVTRPGVSVRARRGYVAVPRRTPATTALAPALASLPVDPIEPTEIRDSTAPPIANPDAEPVTTAGTVVPPGNNTSGGFRVRPGAEAHAKRLASADAIDADAAAGWEAYQRGDVEQARSKLAVAAARPDADAWVHYTLGMSAYALGQFREAATAWERVRTASADFQPVYFDLIDAYLQLKEHDRAIRTARLALEQWPQDAELFDALGVVQTVRGSLDDAIRSFQAAIAIAPADPTGHFNLAKALELRYYKSRRYVRQLQRWVSNEADRTAAIEGYERYLSLDGPYAAAARAGLTRLKWVPTPK